MRHFAVLVEATGLPGEILNEPDKRCGFFTTAFVSAEHAESAGKQAVLAVTSWFAKSIPAYKDAGIEAFLAIEDINEVAELPSAITVQGATWFADDSATH